MASVPDEEAFNAFVASRSAALMRTAFLLTRDRQLAEDLVQTALFKAARRWEHINGDVEAYVRRILYTENISWWRRRRIVETPVLASAGSVGETRDLDLQMSVESALDRLTLKQRTVLVLRYYEDLTEAETARVLGVSVGTVKSTHRQALSRLRSLAPDLGALIGVDHD